MAQATTAASAAEAPPSSGKKKSGRGKWLILLGGLALLAGGGTAGWYYFGHSAGDDDAPAKAKVEPAKPPVFVALETFTVNLQNDQGQPRFLQTNVTAKVTDATAEAALKLHAPAIRNAVLLLLSGKRASELVTTEGKQQLADQILATINGTLSGAPPKPAEKPVETTGGAAPATVSEGSPKHENASPAAAPARAADTNGPVQAVLFTAFIIQ